MIWTHHLKNTTYDANFIPEGGSEKDAVAGSSLVTSSFLTFNRSAINRPDYRSWCPMG
jgi:hypothetical protein